LSQGFHLLVDPYDGFGGFSSALMEEIADDFSGKGVLAFPLMPTSFPDHVILSHVTYFSVMC